MSSSWTQLWWRHLHRSLFSGQPWRGSAPSMYEPPWGGQRSSQCILGRLTCTAWLMPRCSLGRDGGRERTHSLTVQWMHNRSSLTQITQSHTSGTNAFRCTAIIYLHDLYFLACGGSGKTVHPTFMPMKQSEVTLNLEWLRVSLY